MINDEVVPSVESAHRLSLSGAVIHSTDPVTHHVLLGLLLVTLVVVIIVLVDLIRGGRFRTTALALTRMLSALAPLLGLFGAAIQLASTALLVAEHNIAAPAVWAPSVMVAAWTIAISAVCGALGVIFTAIFRIDSARRAAKIRD
jgi:hypothetical protein